MSGASQARTHAVAVELPPSVAGSGEHQPVRTELVDTFEGLVALEPDWRDLERRASVPHPFLSHEWICTWWEAFGGGARLHVIVARDGLDGRAVAIAPLMADAGSMFGVLVRRLRLIQNDHTTMADVLKAEKAATLPIYRALWRAIVASAPRWDVLELARLRQTSPTLAALTALAREQAMATGVWHGEASPYLDLTGGWDAMWDRLGSKRRSNLRNRIARLERVGRVAVEEVTAPDAIAAALDEFVKLEASGWKQREGTAIGSEPDALRFYRTLARRASERGWLRLLFLTVDGRRVAGALAAVHDERLFFIKTGYDPDMAAGAPFKVLTRLAIERACHAGLRELDFLGDGEPWKLEWTTTAREYEWLYVFRRTARARWVQAVKFAIAPRVRRVRSWIR